MRRKKILLLMLLGTMLSLKAQMPVGRYSFIHYKDNTLHNDSGVLDSFYQKLFVLQQQHKGVVRVLHIGDSHIQADNFSGTVRQNLQENFGNAGRGLVFPYRVAKTNGPDGLLSSSNAVWNVKRNVFINNPMPIGISGISIENTQSHATVQISVNNTPALNYGFTELTLFHQTGPDCNDVDATDGNGDALFQRVYTGIDNVSHWQLNKPANAVTFTMMGNDSAEKTNRIYGVLMENDSPGVLYNMAGVNGAEFRHYNAARYFFEQSKYLAPNLIILSLGTNEALGGTINTDDMYENIRQMVDSLKQQNPGAVFLFTTPSDSYRRARKGFLKNANTQKSKNTIIRFCEEQHYAFWDLNAVMGGYGSMMYWYRNGLAQRDLIHFTVRGYQLQGNLLYNAIIQGYEKYTERNTK